jgi:hypothetical protein
MCGTEESRAAMIAPWGWIAVAYGGVLAVAAMSVPRVPRRGLLAAACLGYVLAALAAGSFAEALWVQVGAPGVLLLAGYWLSGPFFRNPQPWLERRLLASDHRIFALTRARHAPHAPVAPRPVSKPAMPPSMSSLDSPPSSSAHDPLPSRGTGRS